MGGAGVSLQSPIGGAMSVGVSTGCNSAGTTGTVSNLVVFCGGSNITLSESINGQSATITVVGGAGASFDAGVSTGGNTLGTTGAISNELIFVGGSNITLSQSVNANSATITIIGASPGATAAFFGGVSSGGNTLGTTGTVSNQLVFVGGNSITLSQSVNANSATITISGATTFQSVQTQNLIDLTLGGNTLGTLALVSSGTLTLVGGNSITLSQVGNAITISGATTTQTIQTQSIIRDIIISGNTSGTTADITSGTLVLVGGNDITLIQNANTITISAMPMLSAGISTLGNTSGITGIVDGRLVLVGGNMVTLSQSVFLDSATITISSPNMLSGGVSNLGNTLGTTGAITELFVLVGGNNITLSQSAVAGFGTGTITISAANQSLQTQNIIRDVNILGNTIGTTADITSGTLTLAGGNSITLSQVGNAITISGATTSQSVQTQNLIDVTLSGNTIGTLALISSGTITLAGGNSITLSQVGNAVTISGPTTSQSVQTQSIIRDINILGNTIGTTADITSGTLTLAGGNSITLSQVGNAITISGATTFQSVQTQNLIDVTLSGNTAGTLALVSSGTLTLVGGNSITLSQVGNAITISGATTSQSVQTQNLIDITLSGNTAGTLALISSGTLTLAGGSNITLSQVGNAITISGATAAGGTFSGGVSNLGNTAGTTGVVTNLLVIAGGSNVTVSQSLNAGSVTITINAATVAGGSFSAGVSNIGNTLGSTGTVSQQIVFAGGNNITLSQSTNGNSATITISAFNQSVQTQNLIDITLSGNTAGTLALVSSGTLTLVGGNSITLSQVGNAITISGASTSQSVQTQNLVVLTLGGNTSGTLALMSSGTITLAGGNRITLSQVGNAITISGPGLLGSTHQHIISGNTSGTTAVISTGTMNLVGGNNITLSQNGNDVTISGATTSQSVQTQNLIDITLSGNTAGTLALVSSGTLTLAGGNSITLSQVGNAITISGATTSQSIQTQSIIQDIIISGNTSGTTASISSGTLVLVGGNEVVLSQNANTITISVSAPLTAGMSNLGNTSGTTGPVHDRLILVGGNNITLNQSVNLQSATLTISGPNMLSVGVSTGGNTLGTTGLASQVMDFVGGNNITLSQSLAGGFATMTISAASQSVQTQNLVVLTLGGNTSGTLALMSSGTITLAGGNRITLSQVGNAFTISAINALSAGVSNLGNTIGTTGL